MLFVINQPNLTSNYLNNYEKSHVLILMNYQIIIDFPKWCQLCNACKIFALMHCDGRLEMRD